MLNAGKDLAAVLQSLEVSEATLHRWRREKERKGREKGISPITDRCRHVG
jgi:transposase-like protein